MHDPPAEQGDLRLRFPLPGTRCHRSSRRRADFDRRERNDRFDPSPWRSELPHHSRNPRCSRRTGDIAGRLLSSPRLRRPACACTAISAARQCARRAAGGLAAEIHLSSGSAIRGPCLRPPCLPSPRRRPDRQRHDDGALFRHHSPGCDAHSRRYLPGTRPAGADRQGGDGQCRGMSGLLSRRLDGCSALRHARSNRLHPQPSRQCGKARLAGGDAALHPLLHRCDAGRARHYCP